MRIINCAKCGKLVETRSPRTKYCPACATRVRLEHQNKWRAGSGKLDPAHTKHITCEICGKDVIVSSKAARAKYCPECSTKAFKASVKKYRDKEKELTFDAGNYPIYPKRKYELAEPRKIHCERCGCEVVLTDARSFNRKYCDACKKIVYAELMKKGTASRRERNRTDGLQGNQKRCARCGVIFERRGFRKYCDDCRSLARLEQNRAWLERKKEISKDGPHAEKEVKRKKKKPSLEELERAAHERGMSYGRYKAWLYMQQQKGDKTK